MVGICSFCRHDKVLDEKMRKVGIKICETCLPKYFHVRDAPRRCTRCRHFRAVAIFVRRQPFCSECRDALGLKRRSSRRRKRPSEICWVCKQVRVVYAWTQSREPLCRKCAKSAPTARMRPRHRNVSSSKVGADK